MRILLPTGCIMPVAGFCRVNGTCEYLTIKKTANAAPIRTHYCRKNGDLSDS